MPSLAIAVSTPVPEGLHLLSHQGRLYEDRAALASRDVVSRVEADRRRVTETTSAFAVIGGPKGVT